MSRYRRLVARRLATGVACAALLSVTACGPVIGGTGGTAPSPAPQPSGGRPGPLAPRMGVVLGHLASWEPDAEVAADLDAIAASGATWVTVDFDWQSIERRPGVFDWDQGGVGGPERSVRMARERGLQVLGMMAYTPGWARPAACVDSDKCAPADPSTYARFVRRAVERYAPLGVHHWQVWNEPNSYAFWRPRPDPSSYTALLAAAHREIKAVDPTATVLAGGLSPQGTDPSGAHLSPADFLSGIYRSGGRGSFEALAHHPYAFNGGSFPFDGHPLNGFVQTAFLHDVMVRAGDGAKKIWATEVGAPTGTAPGYSVTEAMQVRIVDEFLDGWNGWVNFRYPDDARGSVAFDAFTGPFFWYQIRDQGTDPADREQNFGLLRRDGSPKPAYGAFCRRGEGSACRVASAPPDAATGAPAQLTVQAAGSGRAVAPNRVTGGYYVLDPRGGVSAFGGAPYFGSPRFGFDIARGIAVMPDGAGYVVLDGWGGVHRYGSASTLPAPPGYWRGWDIARSVAIAPDGQGYAVLDRWGGVHRAGRTPDTAGLPYWAGRDLARALVFPPSGGAYVLDAWGGIHAARGAPSLAYLRGPYWPGSSIAKDLVITPTGRGFALLDAYGGVHTRGDAPALARPPILQPSTSWDDLALSDGSYVVVRRR